MGQSAIVSAPRRVTVGRAAAILLALGTSVGALHAQGAVLTGSVRDNRGLPVAGAEVAVRGNAIRTRTDESGTFRFTGVPVGLTYVSARAPGVLPAVELLRITPQDSLQFILERIYDGEDSSAFVRSAERAYERDLQRYAAATSAARTAAVVTEREIAERSPALTTDLFRTMIGFQVIGNGVEAVVVTKTAGCRANVFIDGQEQVRYNLNEMRPSAIKVLLAYNSFAALPPTLRSFRVEPRCGTISIITR